MRQRGHTELNGRRFLASACALLSLALAASMLLALSLAPSAGAQGRDFYGVGSQGPLQDRDFELMAGAHVGNIRVLVNRPDMRRADGSYDFDGLDGVVGRAAVRGIRILPFIYQRPPPTNRAQRRELASFARTMVERYGFGGAYWELQYGLDAALAGVPGAAPRPISSWQILNEMNGPAYWGARPRPRVYAQAVRASARAIRQVNPRAEIVLGGMFATPSGKGAMTSWRYLRRLYNLRGIPFKRFFNTVAIHPYAPGIRGVRRQIRRFRQIMRNNRHRRANLRVTEYGWGSARGRHRLLKGPQGQRRLLARSLRMMTRHRNRWNLRGVHWFSWQDGGVACPFCESSGLVRRDRTTKPSYNAYRNVAG